MDYEDEYPFYVMMQDVYEKLLILGYDEDFVKIVKLPPIHRFYFLCKVNPGEQFFNFVSISVWLLNKCGNKMEMPNESDDPNLVIAKILEAIRNMGGIVDFLPSKVKSGQGSDVISCLDFLTTKALAAIGHTYEEMVPEDEDDEDEVVELDEEPELDLERIEEEMEHVYSGTESEHESEDNDIAWVAGIEKNDSTAPETEEQQKMIKSEMDAEQWRLEVERVLPQLKITVKTDGQDWRWRQDQMKTHATGISKVLDELEAPLEKLIADGKADMDKVANREKHLNTQFAPQLQELTKAQERVNDLREIYKELSNAVGTKNKALSSLTEDLDEIRRQLEDRGSVMADGAPVVTTKKALNALKKELKDMEVEIGVMEHCVLKSLMQEQSVLRDGAKI